MPSSSKLSFFIQNKICPDCEDFLSFDKVDLTYRCEKSGHTFLINISENKVYVIRITIGDRYRLSYYTDDRIYLYDLNYIETKHTPIDFPIFDVTQYSILELENKIKIYILFS